MKKKSGKKGERNGGSPVRAKKHLGQHFLKDEEIARKIAHTLSLENYEQVLEIGPGTGVMTKYLLERGPELTVIDLDSESIAYLNEVFPISENEALEKAKGFHVVEADFLQANLHDYFGDKPFAITGNFPYNISTQIVFRLLEYREQVPEFSGMFQMEVAKRICEKEGSKAYGILSVLTQAYYDAEYLFTVPPDVFNPPPKVDSGVLRLKRKENYVLDCDEALFYRVVKTAFNQRRKTLRNSLKTFALSDNLKEDAIFDRRPEQLSVREFIALTKKIANDSI